jgi:hypothetical protein
MASARAEEIKKLKEGVAEAEQRLAAMTDSLESLRVQASEETKRLHTKQEKLLAKAERLRTSRSALTGELDPALLRNYERIRQRAGIAFVAAVKGRCTACKMVIPHQIYVHVRKADDVINCESCGRLMYWAGNFPEEQERENAPKTSPPKRRKSAETDASDDE